MRSRGKDVRPRRKHSKIDQLPEPVRKAVYAKYEEGHTYEEIAAWLAQLGHPIGKSSVARKFKDFESRLQLVKIAREQAETLVREMGNRPAMELEEANANIAQQMIQSVLVQADLSPETITPKMLLEVLRLVPRLQSSASTRERTKLQFRKLMDTAIKQLEKKAKAEAGTPGGTPLDPETLRRIKEEVYGLVA